MKWDCEKVLLEDHNGPFRLQSVPSLPYLQDAGRLRSPKIRFARAVALQSPEKTSQRATLQKGLRPKP